jgi:myo-inositol catabolism protein IolC
MQRKYQTRRRDVKLSDIDMLVTQRKHFMQCNDLLQLALNGRSLSVKYGDHFVSDPKTLEQIKAIILKQAQKNYDEAKTRLMMLGVTEFPDVPTAK